jgi:uncharacterized membrane protein YcaP (DUF421 family)
LDWLDYYIGTDPQTILWWQMSIRAVLIFFVGLVFIRYGGKRVFGKNSSFDIVLGVILGSILSRALTGNSRFIPTVAAAFVMVVLHRLMAEIAFKYRWFGHIIKGEESQLVANGEILWKQMKKNSITEHDLKEAFRNSGVADLSSVKEAYLERNGKISVIK